MIFQLLFSTLALSAVVTLASAKTLIVGQNQGGWTLGVKYGTLNADIGDSLVSKYRAQSMSRYRVCLYTHVFRLFKFQ